MVRCRFLERFGNTNDYNSFAIGGFMFKKNKDNIIIKLGLGTALLSTMFSLVIIRLLFDIKQSSGKG